MTKNFLFALGLLCLSSVASFAQNKRTVLSATIDGYKRDMVYFDCVQSPFIRSFTPIRARSTSMRSIPTAL